MIAPSIRLKQDKFSRRRLPQSLDTARKVGDMNLQFVTVWVEEIERVTLAVILLPLLHSGIHQARTKCHVVRRRYGKRNVVVCRTHGALGQFQFERQTYPKFARGKIRAFVPPSHRMQPESLAVEAECAIQISDRKRYVIQARNHTQKANTGNLKRCPYE